MALSLLAVVVVAVLLIGAVVFGVVRNNKK